MGQRRGSRHGRELHTGIEHPVPAAQVPLALLHNVPATTQLAEGTAGATPSHTCRCFCPGSGGSGWKQGRVQHPGVCVVSQARGSSGRGMVAPSSRIRAACSQGRPSPTQRPQSPSPQPHGLASGPSFSDLWSILRDVLKSQVLQWPVQWCHRHRTSRTSGPGGHPRARLHLTVPGA